MLINPTFIKQTSRGRWYSYQPKQVNEVLTTVRVRLEYGCEDDTFDVYIRPDQVSIEHSYHSTYGRTTGSTAPVSVALAADILEIVDQAILQLA